MYSVSVVVCKLCTYKIYIITQMAECDHLHYRMCFCVHANMCLCKLRQACIPLKGWILLLTCSKDITHKTFLRELFIYVAYLNCFTNFTLGRLWDKWTVVLCDENIPLKNLSIKRSSTLNDSDEDERQKISLIILSQSRHKKQVGLTDDNCWSSF